MRTSDSSIYAVGDVAVVKELVTGDPALIPLAGPANKQGRIAADNIAGLSSTYGSTQGTSAAKVFELTAASTGLNEKSLIKRGLVRGKDFESILITQNSHAGYYPGASPMFIKLLFSPDGKKLFGAQIVDRDGVDKRIDTISAVMRLGGGVRELKELELAYAPPYSSAKDPVNMAGFVAENVINGLVRFSASGAITPPGYLCRTALETWRSIRPESVSTARPIPKKKNRTKLPITSNRKIYKYKQRNRL